MTAKVIVIANEKGGTGKSTLAMHLIVSLLRAGKKVASFDLDARQGTLTRYIQNRNEFAKLNGIPLPVPEHMCWTPDRSKIYSFTAQVEKMLRNFDVIIVDTPGAHSPLMIEAMTIADTVLTPINDSLIDLDVLSIVDGDTLKIKGPSQYAQAVWQARQQRMLERRPTLNWIVVRNRLNHFKSKNKQIVEDILNALSRRIHFTVAAGISERVTYRELFLKGLTMMDCKENGLNMPLSISSLVATHEIRALLNFIMNDGLTAEDSRDNVSINSERTPGTQMQAVQA